MSTPDKQTANIVLYARLMETIKWRVDAVQRTLTLLKSGVHYLDNRLVAEFCLLQFRFCCELLAIGCVAIHTDVSLAKRLRKAWNAHEIMAAFEKLKPSFFPDPIKSETQSDGKIAQNAVTDALTKEQLLKMYHFFGRLLHSGTFDSHVNPKPKTYDFRLIDEFLEKFVKLLDDHTYLLHDGEWMVRICMNDVNSGSQVAWNILKRTT